MLGHLARTAFIVALFALVPVRAEAQYLDPGAGSVVVQALVAGLLGAATVLKLYWGKVRGVFRRGAGRES
ncbi:MAG: hypothetical protein AB7R55_09590 [Gemmatimonadales bacterium]